MAAAGFPAMAVILTALGTSDVEVLTRAFVGATTASVDLAKLVADHLLALGKGDLTYEVGVVIDALRLGCHWLRGICG